MLINNLTRGLCAAGTSGALLPVCPLFLQVDESGAPISRQIQPTDEYFKALYKSSMTF